MAARGVHFLLDLSGCDLNGFVASLQELQPLRAFISEMIREASLTELGAHYHYFAPHAVTAVVALAESHLTFHTWPEHEFVTLDLYTCRAEGAQRAVVRGLVESIAKRLFNPGSMRCQEIER